MGKKKEQELVKELMAESGSLFTLTKRELFAAMALANVKASTAENAASTALAIADALIAALDPEPTTEEKPCKSS